MRFIDVLAQLAEEIGIAFQSDGRSAGETRFQPSGGAADPDPTSRIRSADAGRRLSMSWRTSL
jgi:hypothetical protein